MRRMTDGIVAALLCALAIVLVAYFIQYRIDDDRACPGSFDVICSASDTILPLGYVRIDPAPGSILTKFHGWTYGERGLRARHGYSPLVAGIAGIALPVVLIFFGLRLFRPRKSN
jgi:hypothetical protein